MELQATDAKGRVRLPKGFADSVVIIEQVSDSEIRIRKAVIIPEEEVRFVESFVHPLNDEDRDRFLDLIDNPPSANSSLKRAATRK